LAEKKFTPMMEQYFNIKEDYKHCLVFFRMGDFYELFFGDALIASKELEITLTGRDCGMDEKAPMCGVPYHSVDSYIARLIEKNYKVAICEQVSDPKLSKTIVKREVVRVITKGTVLDSTMLDEGKNNYLMSILEKDNCFGVSFCDISTGEFLTTEFLSADMKKVIDEIEKFKPSEIIANENFSFSKEIENIFGIKINIYKDWTFENIVAEKKLTTHFGVLNLDGFGLVGHKYAIAASGALLEYLYETQMNALSHINSVKLYSDSDIMNIDLSSRRNLELTETMRDKNKKGSLLHVLDSTKTPMGSRLIRKWIEEPLLNVSEIEKRLDCVAEMKSDVLLREEIKEILHTIHDIPRILSRIIYKTCNGRDLIMLKNSIKNLPAIKILLSNCKSKLFTEFKENLETLEDLTESIEQSIFEDAPFSVREGNIINDNYNEKLDEYRETKAEGTDWLFRLENEEKEKTGIKNLRIKYNKIFGYFIEITNSYKDLVPENYIRRQTLANCERFIVDELKIIESKILEAEENINSLEYNLFMEIVEKTLEHIDKIQTSTEIISKLDTLISFAEVADKNNYCRPTFNKKGEINITNGRHPVVEQRTEYSFVPNNTTLNKKERLAIITGPNMAGKSTFMRQTALIVLMSQIGSFVPADNCDTSIVDRIFTRVGASDDLATGQSTFMVEMIEVSNILNNATKNSLLILDEIGRGTSTYDGLSIAWSVLEYIASKKNLGAKTLFATHYHEITDLEEKIDGVINYNVTVEEVGSEVVFLRKIERGRASSSYGIHVAKLAGIPKSVTDRATQILKELDNIKDGNGYEITPNSDNAPYEGVVYEASAFEKNTLTFLEGVANLDVNNITPIESLDKLSKLQNQIKNILGSR